MSGISRGIDVYGNQIISDDGRGIMFNGRGQGSSDGTTFCRAFDDRSDAPYARAVPEGDYVDNNVYGLRDRYHSGSNSFEHNVVLVANDIDGPAAGAYIGSDSADPDMRGIVLRNNIFILRQGEGTGERDVNYFDAAGSIDFSDSRYIGELSTDGSRVTHLTMSNNTVSDPPLPGERADACGRRERAQRRGIHRRRQEPLVVRPPSSRISADTRQRIVLELLQYALAAELGLEHHVRPGILN